VEPRKENPPGARCKKGKEGGGATYNKDEAGEDAEFDEETVGEKKGSSPMEAVA
jgi:hypothetical protein